MSVYSKSYHIKSVLAFCIVLLANGNRQALKYKQRMYMHVHAHVQDWLIVAGSHSIH